jgi:hypothetical protein
MVQLVGSIVCSIQQPRGLNYLRVWLQVLSQSSLRTSLPVDLNTFYEYIKRSKIINLHDSRYVLCHARLDARAGLPCHYDILRIHKNATVVSDNRFVDWNMFEQFFDDRVNTGQARSNLPNYYNAFGDTIPITRNHHTILSTSQYKLKALVFRDPFPAVPTARSCCFQSASANLVALWIVICKG